MEVIAYALQLSYRAMNSQRRSDPMSLVAAFGEPRSCVVGADEVHTPADRDVEGVAGPRAEGLEDSLQLAPAAFDGVFVWRVGRQEEQPGPRRLDQFPDPVIAAV